ncbi:hypothetical protein CK203_114252 [Vitis vinifera]|uniref:Reverse transcriptase Ty1/copia-type domain-containing protein n=1 Tax=Vitis vinifera TaxID=29760 RepID=A0A438CAB4_VITVI|nr:hypothetical protein CK203_114252 [Vitis vinifera]
MEKLQIEDRRQQEEIGEDPKKEESPLALPHPQQVQEFSKCMHSEFEMSMMGELNFFLGLQIKQLKEGTFINQAKYIRDLLKRFNMEESKTMKTPMSSSIKLDKYEKVSPSSVRHNQFQHHSRAPRVSVVSASLSTYLVSFVSVFLMAPRRESAASRAQGKRSAKPS